MATANALLAKLASEETLQKWIDQAQQLTEPVGEEPFDVEPRLDAKADGTTLQIFDQPLTARGSFTTQARLVGQKARLFPFGGSDVYVIPDGQNAGELQVAADLGIDTQLSTSASALKVSARAASSARFDYRHLATFRQATLRATALSNLVLGSRVPNLIDLDRDALDVGEVHRLDARLGLDLGLSATAGYQASQRLAVDLSHGLSAPFTADVAASLRAAIGLSLFERLYLAVGRACQIHDGWIRIRLEREHQRRFSFGVTFALDLDYDLGTGLAQLFEQATSQLPTPRLVTTARKILAYGDPEVAKEKLTGELAETLDDLVGEKIVGSLAELPALAKEIVDAYDKIDDEVASLWDRVLSKLDLGAGSPARQWLTELSRLNDQDLSIDDLLSGEARQWVSAIEAFTGRSIEEILLTDSLKQTLARVGEMADQALAFIDDTPAAVMAKIKAFEQKTGIAATLQVLRGLQTPEQLRQQVSSRIQNLAGRLVGKAFDQIDTDDLARIKAWAEEASGWVAKLDPNDPASPAFQLRQKIKGYLEQAKLDYGLNVGLEIDRISRSSALLDLELDPDDDYASLRADVGRSLATGDARGILTRLVEESNKERYDDADLPFQLRQCVFTSERIRTSALSIVFNLAGLGRALGIKQKSTTQRIEQTRVEVRQEDGALVRHGRYSGAFSRGEQRSHSSTEGALWLVAEDSGPGDLDAPYSGDASADVRLTYSWESDAVSTGDLSALDFLLFDLGFVADHRGRSGTQADPRLPSLAVTAGTGVRFAFELRFGRPVLETLLAAAGTAQGRELWDLAFLNAAHRWLDEGLVSGVGLVATNPPANLGAVASTLVKSPTFRQLGDDAGAFNGSVVQGRENLTLSVDGKKVAVRFTPPGKTALLTYDIIAKRRDLTRDIKRRGLRQLESFWKAAVKERTDAAYRELIHQLARRWRQVSLYDQSWPNPLGVLWLWIAAVNEIAPEELKTARGVATLRWQQPEGEAAGGAAGGGDAAAAAGDGSSLSWSPPELFTLTEGQGIPDNRPLVGRHVFPIA